MCAVPLFGQGLRFGIEAGVPITQYFDTGEYGSLHGGGKYSAATRRYTVGAAAEWRLTNTFGFELEAMYHRMGYVGIVNFFDSGIFRNSQIDVKGNSWDFPLMAKYRFGWKVRPYVAGGGVLRYVGPVRGRGQQTNGSLITQTSTTIPLDTTEPSELRKRFYPGLTVAAGVELGGERFGLLPELRVTHWTANIAGPGGLLRFASNQIEFLLGLRF
ncbi:MAG TPA: outer membrane beta-barrel protein [Bryobacteraceae bacterium]|nr:outer membrane beta-barrel protein [Bryobacteraceae bacterium]